MPLNFYKKVNVFIRVVSRVRVRVSRVVVVVLVIVVEVVEWK